MSHFFKKGKPDAQTSVDGSNGSTASSSTASLPNSKPLFPSSSDGTSLKIVERQISSHNAVDTLKPFIVEYALMSEYVLLHKNKIQGAYIVPSAGSALKWFGALFIRNGLYQGGIFRFTLYIPDNFPECHSPVVVFEPPVFHPLIDIETGELDIKRGFPKWRRNSNHLWQVISYARRVFYKIETQNPLNTEAASLFERDLELYKLRIAENLNICHEHLYEKPISEDNHAIWFSPWDPTVHQEFKQKILSPKPIPDEDACSKDVKPGLSWVEKGTTQILSKKEL